jgi:hypothetical protein
MALTKFFNDLNDLDKVDWSVMPLTWWNDTPTQPDRKRRRQAEFLVRSFVPLVCFRDIGVCTTAIGAAVRAEFAERGNAPAITVRRQWYYGGGER